MKGFTTFFAFLNEPCMGEIYLYNLFLHSLGMIKENPGPGGGEGGG